MFWICNTERQFYVSERCKMQFNYYRVYFTGNIFYRSAQVQTVHKFNSLVAKILAVPILQWRTLAAIAIF